MPKTKVTEEQFTIAPGLITHVPTGARFSFYPNSESRDVHINYGESGNLLSNGDEYMREDVASVAGDIFNKIRSTK